jgi:hypothetical protein
LQTTALKLSFLAVDSAGDHEIGDPREETNPITMKYNYAYREGARRVTLKAIPTGTIRYTLDGSNPRNGGIWDRNEVIVPDGRDVLLAIAEARGIWSEQIRVDVPNAGVGTGGADFNPDLHRPAEWRRRLTANERGRSFKILESLKRHRAITAGVDVTVSLQGNADDYIVMNFGPNVTRTSEEIERIAIDLVDQLGTDGGVPDVALIVHTTRFDSGTALVEAAKELGLPLQADEVRQ